MLNVKFVVAALAAAGMAAWAVPAGADNGPGTETGCSEYGMTAPPLAERKPGAAVKEVYEFTAEECAVQLAARGTPAEKVAATNGDGSAAMDTPESQGRYEFRAEESGWQLAPPEIRRKPVS